MINVLAELRTLAKERSTNAPAWLTTELSVRRVQAGMRDRDVEELELLFALPDTRNA